MPNTLERPPSATPESASKYVPTPEFATEYDGEAGDNERELQERTKQIEHLLAEPLSEEIRDRIADRVDIYSHKDNDAEQPTQPLSRLLAKAPSKEGVGDYVPPGASLNEVFRTLPSEPRKRQEALTQLKAFGLALRESYLLGKEGKSWEEYKEAGNKEALAYIRLGEVVSLKVDQLKLNRLLADPKVPAEKKREYAADYQQLFASYADNQDIPPTVTVELQTSAQRLASFTAPPPSQSEQVPEPAAAEVMSPLSAPASPVPQPAPRRFAESDLEFEPKLETYRSIAERKTRANEQVLRTRQQALEDMLLTGKEYPPHVHEFVINLDSLESGRENQQVGRAKWLIPERYFDDPRAKAEVNHLVDELWADKPLKPLLEEAYAAAKNGDRKKLVALKLVGSRLLQEYAPKSVTRQAWEVLSEDGKRTLRLGEMMTIYAELSIASIHRQEGKLSREQALALEKRFAKYAQNDDIPDYFRKLLGKASLTLSSGTKRGETVAVSPQPPVVDTESVLTEQPGGSPDDTAVMARGDTSLTPPEGKVIKPLNEDEAVFAESLDEEEMAEYYRQQAEKAREAAPESTWQEPGASSEEEYPLAPDTAVVDLKPRLEDGETVFRAESAPRAAVTGEAPDVPSYRQSPERLKQREQQLFAKYRQYRGSTDPTTRQAFELIENYVNNNEDDDEAKLLDYEDYLVDLVEQEKLPDPQRDERRKRYLSLFANELAYGKSEEMNKRLGRLARFVNALTSRRAERYVAQVSVGRNLKSLFPNPGAWRDVLRAREDAIRSMRRAAVRQANRDPQAAALLVQIADRFELTGIDEARDFQRRYPQMAGQ